MEKRLGITIVLVSVVAAICALAIYFNLRFWLQPPKTKFTSAWSTDLSLLEKTASLPKEWKMIKDISVRTDNSPAQDWINPKNVPIPKNPNGIYKLDIFLTHWIDGHRYGVVIQYDLYDQRTRNLVWHLGRTFKLGIVY